MAIGDDEVRCKHALGTMLSNQTKRLKVSLRVAQSSALTKSSTEEKSFLEKCDFVMDSNSKEDGVKKVSGNRVKNSPESETRSAADKIDDKAPPTQFTGTKKSEKEHKSDVEQNCVVFASETEMKVHVSDQAPGCLAPTSTSEAQVGFEVSESRDSLKARVAEMKRETCKLARELQKHAVMSIKLRNANSLLMDELKKMCEPNVIQILEALNPDNHPQADGEMELNLDNHPQADGEMELNPDNHPQTDGEMQCHE